MKRFGLYLILALILIGSSLAFNQKISYVGTDILNNSGLEYNGTYNVSTFIFFNPTCLGTPDASFINQVNFITGEVKVELNYTSTNRTFYIKPNIENVNYSCFEYIPSGQAEKANTANSALVADTCTAFNGYTQATSFPISGDVTGTLGISMVTTLNLSKIAYNGLLGLNNLTKCSPGEILEMSGSSWDCGTDSTGTDTNNYPTALIVTNGSTHTITLSRNGLGDLVATFDDQVAGGSGSGFTLLNASVLRNESGYIGIVKSFFDDNYYPYSLNPANYITDGNTNWDNSYGFTNESWIRQQGYFNLTNITALGYITSGIQNNSGNYKINFSESNGVYFVFPGDNIQTIIDNVPDGSEIKLVRGTHTLPSDGLKLNKTLIISGEGNQTILSYSGTGSAIHTGNAARIDMMKLQDFEIVNLQKEQGVGINTSEMRHADIRNIKIRDFGIGIQFVKFYNHVYNPYIIGNCLIGIDIPTNQNSVYGGQITGCNYSSINITGFGNLITDIALEYVKNNSIGLYVSGDNNAFINNWIESDNYGTAVYLAATASGNNIIGTQVNNLGTILTNLATGNYIDLQGIAPIVSYSNKDILFETTSMNTTAQNIVINSDRTDADQYLLFFDPNTDTFKPLWFDKASWIGGAAAGFTLGAGLYVNGTFVSNGRASIRGTLNMSGNDIIQADDINGTSIFQNGIQVYTMANERNFINLTNVTALGYITSGIQNNSLGWNLSTSRINGEYYPNDIDTLHYILNNLCTTGCIIHLPKTTLISTQTLNLSNNVQLEGYSANSIINCTASADPCIKSKTGGRIYNIVMSNIAFNGLNSDLTHRGLDFSNISASQFTNLIIQNFNEGLFANGSNYYNDFYSLSIKNNNYNIHLTGSSNENRFIGGYVQNGNYQSLLIDNSNTNSFYGISWEGTNQIINITGTNGKWNSFIGNRFEILTSVIEFGQGTVGNSIVGGRLILSGSELLSVNNYGIENYIETSGLKSIQNRTVADLNVTGSKINFNNANILSTGNITTSTLSRLYGFRGINTISNSAFYFDQTNSLASFIFRNSANGGVVFQVANQTIYMNFEALVSSLIPRSNNTYNLGNDTHRFTEAYINNLNSNGRVINSTTVCFSDGTNCQVGAAGSALKADGVWLYNDTTTIYFNGTYLNATYYNVNERVGNSSAEIQAAELDAAHDTCAEIGGCPINASLDNRYIKGSQDTWGFSSIDGLYLLNTSNVLTFSESKLNQTISAYILSTNYYATNFSVLRGTYNVGNLSSINSSDNYQLNVTELNGVNPLTIEFNFTGVEDINSIIIHFWYSPTSSHSIAVALWDYENSMWEEEYGILTSTNGYEYFISTVFDASEHIQNGMASLRLRHIDNGLASHQLSIDYVTLLKGFSTISTTDNNNHPVSMQVTGTTTKIINLELAGLDNITASFTDIDTDTDTYISNPRSFVNLSNLSGYALTTQLNAMNTTQFQTNATIRDDYITNLLTDANIPDTITVSNYYLKLNPYQFINGSNVSAYETDSAHDTCAEIGGCPINASLDNRYLFLSENTTLYTSIRNRVQNSTNTISCTGSDKYSSITLTNGVVSGTCTADQTGSGDTVIGDNLWTYNITSGGIKTLYWNVSAWNESFQDTLFTSFIQIDTPLSGAYNDANNVMAIRLDWNTSTFIMDNDGFLALNESSMFTDNRLPNDLTINTTKNLNVWKNLSMDNTSIQCFTTDCAVRSYVNASGCLVSVGRSGGISATC